MAELTAPTWSGDLEALTELIFKPAPAYDAAGDFHEGFVDKREAFKADAQSPEVMKPRDGSLDDPAGFARPLP